MNYLKKEAEIIAEVHPSKDARVFARNVIEDLTTLQARIDELEILNEELTDLYNKHMRSWAERQAAQNATLDELLELILDKYNDGDFKGIRQIAYDYLSNNRKNGG
jgi:citrate lyase synthetase